jgi:hypothetical protein
MMDKNPFESGKKVECIQDIYEEWEVFSYKDLDIFTSILFDEKREEEIKDRSEPSITDLDKKITGLLKNFFKEEESRFKPIILQIFLGIISTFLHKSDLFRDEVLIESVLSRSIIYETDGEGVESLERRFIFTIFSGTINRDLKLMTLDLIIKKIEEQVPGSIRLLHDLLFRAIRRNMLVDVYNLQVIGCSNPSKIAEWPPQSVDVGEENTELFIKKNLHTMILNDLSTSDAHLMRGDETPPRFFRNLYSIHLKRKSSVEMEDCNPKIRLNELARILKSSFGENELSWNRECVWSELRISIWDFEWGLVSKGIDLWPLIRIRVGKRTPSYILKSISGNGCRKEEKNLGRAEEMKTVVVKARGC